MQNIDLAEKSGTLLNINIYYHMWKWVNKF